MSQTASAAGKFASRLFDTIRGDILQNPSPKPSKRKPRCVPVQICFIAALYVMSLQTSQYGQQGRRRCKKRMHPHVFRLVDGAEQMPKGNRCIQCPLSI